MPETPNIVIESQNTSFVRVGETYQTIVRATPTIPALATLAQQYISDPTVIPGGVVLNKIMAESETTYPGYDSLAALLQAIVANWPAFEASTSDLYARSYAVARAAAQSGPTNVRGGTAQQGFELAELDALYSINRFKEVWTSWLQAWSLQMQAVKLSNDIPAALRAQWLQSQAQESASEHSQRMDNVALAEVYNAFNKTLIEQYSAAANFGQSTMRTEETFTGQGSQSGITTGFGMSSYR